jgi:cytochrome c551/c552
MPRAILLAAALLGACLPAFAPAIRAAKHHRGVSPSASDTSCLGCHPTQREAEAHAIAHGAAPIVATWMINDRRGCVGCHDVREPRR